MVEEFLEDINNILNSGEVGILICSAAQNSNGVYQRFIIELYLDLFGTSIQGSGHTETL